MNMKVIVKAIAGPTTFYNGSTDESGDFYGVNRLSFAGLDSQEEFCEYWNEKPECISGGFMEFVAEGDELFVVTSYETTRKLTKKEEEDIIEYTQGQWSDGIGEGFEQNDTYCFDDVESYVSPWYSGQKAIVIYE